MIRHTQGVSYPRSGRGLLHDVVYTYYDQAELVFPPEIIYGYGEVSSAYNWAKHHDFDLSLPVRNDIQYLIQVRNPARAIVSNHLLWCRNTSRVPSAENFREWYKPQVRLWVALAQKWALSKIEKRLIVKYEDMVLYPLETFTKVLEFISDDEVDADKLSQAIEAFNVKPREHMERGLFPANQSCLDDIEKQAKHVMRKLGLPSYKIEYSV